MSNSDSTSVVNGGDPDKGKMRWEKKNLKMARVVSDNE